MTDLLFAFRQLRKSPGFTFVAILTLALGIGANTAIFSVVNAVLLKPLPYPQPEQLVAIGAADTREVRTGTPDSLSIPDFADFRAQNHSFTAMAIYHAKSFALAGAGEAQSLSGQVVSGEFFEVLGVKPVLGRAFTRAEEVAGGGPDGLTVVLSHEFWQKQFRGDTGVIGHVMMLDGQPHTVVGVMPPHFQFPIQTEPLEIYTTIAADASSSDGGKPNTEQRGNHSYEGIGRVKPGVSHEQARSDLRAIAAALEKQYPDTNTYFGVAVLPLREELVGDVSGALYVLFGAVVCVLLIASANVANLLLARATVRAKEIALRSALGAGRGRIIRQLLTESVLLSAIGGALGLMFAAWGTDVLIRLVPQNIPRAAEIRLDPLVLAFTFGVALATGVLFGLAPALHASRLDLRESLNESGRTTGGSARHTLRSSLVIAEVALALILLTGAGLLLQSFNRLSRVNPGFRTERLLTGSVNLPDAAYPKPENIANFYAELLPRLRGLPGVQSVGTIFPLPLSSSNVTTSFDVEERPLPKGQQADSPMRVASVDYFTTMGIPLVRGRLFTEEDQLASKQVMIVNQAFADKFFPGADPIGKRIAPGFTVGPGEETVMREIVGIVANVKHKSLRADFTPEMYVPSAQLPIGIAFLVVRTSTSAPAALTSAVRAELARADAAIPLTRVRVFDEYVTRSLARPRFNATLLAIFAGVALVLTAIGIYGVMAYSVAQRRQEIGIRMALGAQRSHVLRLIVGGGMKLALIGVAIGLAAAFGLTRLLETLLYGVKPFDAATLGSVALLLAVIAFLACWIPARRASGLNPLVALREG